MNRAARLALELAGLGAAVLAYGSLVEAKRLVRERWRIRLRDWPSSLDGLRVGVVSDLHARGPETILLAQRAIRVLIDEAPDVVVIPGDFIPFWSDHAVETLHRALSGIERFGGRCLGTPGNHDWWLGPASLLRAPLAEHGIRLLQNEAESCQGAAWVGIDSAVERKHRPEAAMASAEPGLPRIAIWHEPDTADFLPPGCLMQISGHSHGGQFIAPWGWAPVTTRLGARYRRGFHPNAATPVFVSSGLATTGPPSRLFCPPVVSILALGTLSSR